MPIAKPRRQRNPGRKPIDDRKALTGILFVLKTGIVWEDLGNGLRFRDDLLASLARLAGGWCLGATALIIALVIAGRGPN